MRWIAALLLISAAALKLGQLLSDPAIVLISPLGHLFVPAQIGVELGIGVLLLSGVYWQTLRWATITLFTCFAG